MITRENLCETINSVKSFRQYANPRVTAKSMAVADYKICEAFKQCLGDDWPKLLPITLRYCYDFDFGSNYGIRGSLAKLNNVEYRPTSPNELYKLMVKITGGNK